VAAGADSGVTAGRAVRARSTRQFQAVLAELAKSDDFRSAQDIYAAIRASGASVGLATIYRALQSLVESGRADVLRTDTGEAAFRACGESHHHHLVCRSCGKAVEVQGPAVERWADEIAKKHGFTEVSHTVELFGTCTPCQGRSG
jgi:Fur family transcriptional regulator, ferric uptake regulator